MPIARSRRAFLTATLLISALPYLCGTVAQAQDVDRSLWVIDAQDARDLLAAGALLLDTRAKGARMVQPLAGSVPVTWQEFSNPEMPHMGHLLADDAVLTQKLRALGVSQAIPIVVVADPAKSWGEDGRIVWTLRTLGHAQAFLVDGGVAALMAEGAPSVTAAVVPGDFTVARTKDFEIEKEELAGLIGQSDVVILDTRAQREFAGETPYGESRGGHIPGAKHVYFMDLIGPDGRVLDSKALQTRLAGLGITNGTQVVSYCTAGIRSGFVTAVLKTAGVNARNYAGSMWEWAAEDATAYPLVSN